MRRIVTPFPVWFAVVGAFAEVVILYFIKLRHPLMLLSPDFVWMAPLALLTVIVGVMTLLGLVVGKSRNRMLQGFRMVVPLSLVTFNLLLLVPGLDDYAAAILAAGIAVQLSRVVGHRPESTDRLVRRTGVWIAGGLLASGALIFTALSFPGGTVAVNSDRGRPNVVLITLDTVRAASLSAYGYARQTTPNIERYSKRGVLFEEAFSTAPWTLPSHASVFTGRWPHELSTNYETPLDGRFPTLAEYLRDHGYATGGFIANLKYCGASTGLSRGFIHYEDYSRSIGELAASSTLIRTVADNFRIRRLVRNDEHLNRVRAPEISARALEWIDGRHGAPFFAFLNYFDAHEPYLPPAPFDKQFGPGRRHGRHSPLHHWLWNPAVDHQMLGVDERAEEMNAYDGGLAHLDAELGKFLDALESRGLLSNTLVIITSDHGEEFAEHTVYEHGYSLYRPSVQVPLLFLLPAGDNVPALRFTKPVSLRDLAATIVDTVGLSAGSPFPGASLARLWSERGDRVSTRDSSPLFAEVSPSPWQPDWFPSSRGPMTSIVYQGLRYIRNGDGREELYDFAADPWERTDLAAVPEWQQALVEARAALQRVLTGAS